MVGLTKTWGKLTPNSISHLWHTDIISKGSHPAVYNKLVGLGHGQCPNVNKMHCLPTKEHMG